MITMRATMPHAKKVALSGRTTDNAARMSSLYPSISLSKILWVMYLALAVVFVQGVRLHLHAYAHAPIEANHVHQKQVHTDYSTSDEHAGEMLEVDLTSQSILKKLSLGSLVIALLAVMIVFLSRGSIQCGVWRPDRRTPFSPWRGCQPPPLRGPPLGTGLK